MRNDRFTCWLFMAPSILFASAASRQPLMRFARCIYVVFTTKISTSPVDTKKGAYSAPLMRLSMYLDLFWYWLSFASASSLSRTDTTLLRVPRGRPAPSRFPPRFLFIGSFPIFLAFCILIVLYMQTRCDVVLYSGINYNRLQRYLRIFL